MTGVLDPTFTALPYRDLGDVALDRAREPRRRATPTSASSGSATSTSASATACSRAPPTPRTSGSPSASIHGGAWGFAAGVVLTDRRGRAASPRRAVAVAQVAAAMTTTPGRARSRAGPRRRHLGVVLRRRPVRRSRPPTRPRLLVDWTQRLLRRDGRRSTPPPRCSRSTRTSTTPTSPAPAPPSSGSGCSRVRGDGHRRGDRRLRLDGARSRRRSAAAGSTSPAARVAWDWDAELAETPELLAEKLKAPSVEAGDLRPGHPPVQPVADHPRVDRPRHRARPRARLRGQLRRHLLRDLRPARLAALRLPGHERHRRPHRRARPGHGRLRRRGRRDPELGHRPRRRAGRLPARPGHGADLTARAQRRPLQRLRVRRLPRPHPDPADGQRLAAARPRRPSHRGPDRPGRARPLRRRRQVLVDRHAALQLPVHRPAVLPDRGRPAGRPGARRRLPGHHDRLLGLDGGGRRSRHLGPRRRLQLRQGATRAGRGGEPRLPDRRCSAASASSTPPTRQAS